MVEPLNNLSDFYRGTQVAVGAADRVYEYLFGEKEEKQEKQKEAVKAAWQQEVFLTINMVFFLGTEFFRRRDDRSTENSQFV